MPQVLLLRSDFPIMVLTGLPEVGVNVQVDTDIPRSLADIVGNTYIFQLD